MVQSVFARAIVRLLILMVVALGFARPLPGQQLSSHTLVYAVYQGEATAGDVLASMRKAQEATGEQIESYAVVSRNPEGKIAVDERPSGDAVPSAAIDLMLGTLAEPAADPAVGPKGIRSDVVDSLRASLTPGSSAVIAVLNDRWVPEIQRELQSAQARALMLTRITQGSVGAGAP